jgi:hypothetical protein
MAASVRAASMSSWPAADATEAAPSIANIVATLSMRLSLAVISG